MKYLLRLCYRWLMRYIPLMCCFSYIDKMKYYTEYTKDVYDRLSRTPYYFETSPRGNKPRWIWVDADKKDWYTTWLNIQWQYTPKEFEIIQKTQQPSKYVWWNKIPHWEVYYKIRAKWWAEMHWYIYIKDIE